MSRKLAMMQLVVTGEKRMVSLQQEEISNWTNSIINRWKLLPNTVAEEAGDDTWFDRHGKRINLYTDGLLTAYVWIEE